MTDNIKSQDYITITDTEVMVGGKETTQYRGGDIFKPSVVQKVFRDVQTIVKQEYGAAPIEMHALASKTPGRYLKPGHPSSKEGRYCWVRFLFANDVKTPWCSVTSLVELPGNAGHCAYHCALYVRDNYDFRSDVFRSVTDSIQPNAIVLQIQNPVVGQLIEADLNDSIISLKVISIKEKAK